ncbi:DNA-binding transcriptional LysR family regulator [Winogradskyella wandonensis]|uniref:DNA-binding transcriptional LysR family regulator n=1 Tax=Winogradskyella wandonensis TaxID=1442586 RepID=A0A4R1KXS5_9FLAO|nr:LysR family transcriptional regulator [Winogradskyella wandonensis]TCK69407.1 DNA-binding transcriptional LysR family regulator [Winogradskyella wandonensis]
MNYTLHQLQIFLKVAELKSITKASEELFLSQPAVSMQLKKFQDQFSIPLTEVVGRQLYVTDFGNEIAEAAEKILNEVEAINYKTLSRQGQLAGKLKIAIVSTAKYAMPYFLTGFMQRHKGIDLEMDVTNKAGVIRSLENNDVDFAMVSVLPEHLSLNQVELMSNKLYLVGSSHTEMGSTRVTKAIFEKYPLLYREKGSATRSAMESFLTKLNVPNKKKIELTSNEALKQSLIAGLGISIMPLIGLKNELKDKELHIIPFKGLPIKTNWNLIWLKSKNLSPVASAYLNYVQTEKEKIINETFNWYEAYD